jgi:STE24 endopeptidase
LAIAAQPVTADTPEARRYNRIRRRLSVLDMLLGLGLLTLLLATGWTRGLRDAAFHLAGQRYTLALFCYVLEFLLLFKVAGIGLDIYSFRLEHRFHLSNQSAGSWLWDQVKSFALSLLLVTVLAEFVYNTMRAAPNHWWLISWGVFMGLFLLLAQLAPVLLFPVFYKFEPLKNDALRQRLVRLSERAGTGVRGVYEWKLSEKSNKANAALAGLGRTRRIILADTLLNNYSDDEIEAVLAHELGHHVHRHIVWSLLLQVGVTFVGFYLANLALRYAVDRRKMFEFISDFADLPLLVLVSSALSLALSPVLNAWSRHNERQADRYAWRSIPDVGPFVSSMNKLAGQNLAERSPSRVVELLFHSHPSITKRIAAAEDWQRQRSSELAG